MRCIVGELVLCWQLVFKYVILESYIDDVCLKVEKNASSNAMSNYCTEPLLDPSALKRDLYTICVTKPGA
jgi:hypothetical protein